jgi:hypothetical protein
MSDNPARNMKNGHGILEREGLEPENSSTVLSPNGETENIQDLLELDEGAPEELIAALLFFRYFHQD